MKSHEKILKHKVRLYYLYGNDYQRGYAYGRFNKNSINYDEFYNDVFESLKKKFNSNEYINLCSALNLWIYRLKNNNQIDFFIGFANSIGFDYKKLVRLNIIFDIFGYFCTIITNKTDKYYNHFRICDANKFSIGYIKKYKLNLDILYNNEKEIIIAHSITISKHTVISNKMCYSVWSSYETNYKTVLKNKYPIFFFIYKTYKNANTLEEFIDHVKKISLNDCTYISVYNNNKMDIIKLNNKTPNKSLKKNGFAEISDYSPVIKKTTNIADMLEIYKTIPDTNRCFTIIYDIKKNQLQINNYLSKDVFFEISFKKKNPFKSYLIARNLIYIIFTISLIYIIFLAYYSKINKLI